MPIVTRKNAVTLNTDTVIEDGVESWLPVELGRYQHKDDDLLVEVKDGDRIDLIAQSFYGDTRLKWVIMWANNMELPEVDLHPGRTIIVPSKRRVFRDLVKGG